MWFSVHQSKTYSEIFFFPPHNDSSAALDTKICIILKGIGIGFSFYFNFIMFTGENSKRK